MATLGRAAVKRALGRFASPQPVGNAPPRQCGLTSPAASPAWSAGRSPGLPARNGGDSGRAGRRARRPRALPEPRQVAGDLDRPVGGRQQMQRQRHAPAGERGVVGEAEQFLHPQRDARAALGFVVDRRRGAGRRDEMGRRLGLQPARQVVGQQRVQRLAEFVAGKLVEPRLAEQERRQPVGRGGERRVGEVGPRLAFGAAQKTDPPAPLRQRLRPRQARQPESRIPRASASALASSAGGQRLPSASVSAPSRRRRRARSEAEARSNAVSSRVSIAPPATPRSRSSVSGAAATMRAAAARPTISPIAR